MSETYVVTVDTVTNENVHVTDDRDEAVAVANTVSSEDSTPVRRAYIEVWSDGECTDTLSV